MTLVYHSITNKCHAITIDVCNVHTLKLQLNFSDELSTSQADLRYCPKGARAGHDGCRSSSLPHDGFEHLRLLVAVRERLRALVEQLHHLLVRRWGIAQPVDDVVDLRGEALERLHHT